MQWANLVAANEQLATAKSLESVVQVLRETARKIVKSDGIAVILKEDDRCFYAAEDAMGPLWTPRRFPATSCISGWAMKHRQTVAIADIYLDQRIPHEAYRPTFVRSLVMVPIGSPQPQAAIGAYWADVREPDFRTVAKLEALARSAAIALENARLISALEDSERQRESALSAAGMGTWTLDVDGKELRTSRTCRLSLGADPDREISYDQLCDLIHPDDVGQFRRAIERSAITGGVCDGEYRIATSSGVRWIALRGKPASGIAKSGLLTGVSIDITQRRLMEEQLRTLAAALEMRVSERTAQLHQAEAALRQSQKVEAAGRRTGRIAS